MPVPESFTRIASYRQIADLLYDLAMYVQRRDPTLFNDALRNIQSTPTVTPIMETEKVDFDA